MRVLQVVDKLNVGGAERVIVDMCNILHNNNYHVAILSLLDSGALCKDIFSDIKQYVLKRDGRFSIKSMKEFANIANKHDIIHVHMRHNLRYVILCKMIFNIKSKIVFQDHTSNIRLDFPTKYCLKKVDAYIAVCRKNLETYTKSNIIDKGSSFLLPNIVIHTDIVNDEKMVDNNSRIVMVGNIRKEKNYLFALDIIEDRGIDIYGNYYDIDYKQLFLDKISSRNVRVIEGVSNVQPLLSKYKMALHVSPLETGPLVLIEYLANGIPFLAYRTGEVVEQIKDELPEFIVDSFDREVWLKRIDELNKQIDFEGENLRKKMKMIFQKYYSEDKYFEKCKEVYENVLSY